MTEKAWQEIPEELRESGAIPVFSKEVRIGADREEWNNSFVAELTSFQEKEAAYSAVPPPEAEILPMKVVCNLKTDDVKKVRKKSQRCHLRELPEEEGRR